MRQTLLRFRAVGGRRKGAGRPPRGARSSEPHKQRFRFARPLVAHCTLRVVDDARVRPLRDAGPYHAIRNALRAIAKRASDFRITHLSLEVDHVHALVEATSNAALSKGMQAFQSSAAQRINRSLGRRGPVFADRYHARFITSPTQARRAIAYVLNNWRHHQLDDGFETRLWDVDYFSSGPTFTGWKELADPTFQLDIPPAYLPLPVSRPQTWLLAKGYLRGGPPISLFEVPGRRPPARPRQTLRGRAAKSTRTEQRGVRRNQRAATGGDLRRNQPAATGM